MYRYPRSWVVVLGLCPPPGWPSTPTFGDLPSISARRMDTTLPDWREHGVGANLWWTHEEWDTGAPHHLEQVVRQTGCRTAVALGREVQRALGLRHGEFFTFADAEFAGRHLRVLRFPHPSGLCHVWNEEENREAARAALIAAMRRHPSCTG